MNPVCAWMQQAAATFRQRLHPALPLLHDLCSMQGVYLVDHQCARPCTQPGPPLHSLLMWGWPACAQQHRLLGVDAGRCAQPDRRFQTSVMSTSSRHVGDLLLPICVHVLSMLPKCCICAAAGADMSVRCCSHDSQHVIKEHPNSA